MNTKYQSDIRDKLLDVTEELVYQYGLNATGMELIVKTSGISRKTIYRYFSNKDCLCAQALLRRDNRWMQWFEACSVKNDDAAESILNMFSTLKSWFLTENFRGCAFINSASETADAQHPIRAIAKEHKQKIVSLVATLASQLTVPSVELFSRQILLLIDGAITVAMVMNFPGAADDARAMAKLLIENQTQQ